MGNYYVGPNPAMPNVFFAQGYDVGDPFSKCPRIGPCYCHAGHPCDPEHGIPNPWTRNGTKPYMGPIHPRPKIFVGQRLAAGANKFVYGGDNAWTGPVMSGCQVTPDG